MNARQVFLSLLSTAVLAGCQGQPASSSGSSTPAHSSHAHHEHQVHHHVAPHDGALVVLGKEFAHLELVLEPVSGTLTLYVLDESAEKAVRVPGQPIKIVLDSGTSIELLPQADELTGETKEETSTFRTSAKELQGIKTFTATLPRLVVKDQPFENVKLTYPQGNEPRSAEHHGHSHGPDDEHGHSHDH